MRYGLEDFALIADLTDDEFDLFKSAIKQLLSHTFIIRGVEGQEPLYDFTIRNIKLFESWCSCADAELQRDENLGVIAFRGWTDTRLRLGRDDTSALLVFRLIYEEKRNELTLAKFPSVTVLDFIQKFQAVANRGLKKTNLEGMLRRFSSHRLIEVSGEYTNPETVLVLYPSIALTLSHDAVEELHAAVQKELSVKERLVNGQNNEEMEEA